jgi:hypothetical protein
MSFGGFGAQTNGPTHSQSDGDTMMESPQKKPPAFGTTFGTGNSATPSAPFSFGQSSQSVAPSGFGASVTAQPTNNTFKFGQSQPAAQPGNLFGLGPQKPEEPEPQTSLFGQSTNTSQPAARSFNKPASATSSSSSLFSQSTSTFNPPSNLFGQAPASSATSGNIFGSSAPTTQSSNGGPFSTLFGQAPATAKPAIGSQTSSEVSKPVFNFAPSSSQPAFSFSAAPVSTANATSSNHTSQAPDLTPISSAPDSAVPMFSGGSTSSPFGDIFKPNANARLASPDRSAMSTEMPSAKSNSFAFKPNLSSSQPGFPSNGGLFGQKPSESNTTGELFGRVTPPQESASLTAVPVTSQKPTRDEEEPSTTSNNAANATKVFEKTANPEQTPRPAVEPTKPQEAPTQSLKGFQPQSSTQQPVSSSTSSFGNLLGAPSKKNSSAAQQEEPPSTSSSGSSHFARASAFDSPDASSRPAESQAKQPSWPATKATLFPAKNSSASALTPSTSSKDPAAPQFTPVTNKGTASTTSESHVRLRSYGSSAIPGYLDSYESVEHDSLSRLRNLNTSFQKSIAKLDPAADDFEEIVRHYVAQRARIGHALNLKERNKAGMKRKMDEGEANEEPPNGSKKARTEGFSSETTKVGIPRTATDSSSTSATVQPPNTVITQSTFQTNASDSNTDSSSATSSIFKNMMSSPAPASAFPSMSGTSSPSGNPFASLKASALSSSAATPRSETAAAASGIRKDNVTATNLFASLSAPSSTTFGSGSVSWSKPLSEPQFPSTTPIKSPPKKLAFEVPQFSASSGTSFMDAFAKQSANSVAELQEEAKRKRKAEDFDSDEDDEAEWERKYAEEERTKRNKLESLSKAGSTGFQPLFGGKATSATAKNFFNLANKTSNISSGPEKETSSTGSGSTGAIGKAAEEPAKISDEESSDSRSSEEQGESASQEEGSDQDSEEGDGRDEEDISEGNHDQQEDDTEGEEQTPEYESDDEDIQTAMARSRSKGSLFDRIEPNPNLKPNDTPKYGAQNAQKKPNGISSTSVEGRATPNGPQASQASVNSSFKSFGANGVLNSGALTSTPNAPTMSPFTPINGSGFDTKDPFAPAGSVFITSKKPEIEDASSSKKTNGEKFLFTPNISVSAPSPARSILRGGNSILGFGAIPGEGLFGSRPSTPSNDEPSRGSVFGNLGSGPNFSNSQSDKTYQRGTPVKFGTPNKEGPTVNITAATPPAKDDSSAASKSFPNLFGPKPSKPGADAVASVGFNFGGPTHLTASPLLGPSALSSAVSSRATSPGATDTESVNTDTAEDHSDEPQTSLMSSRPGEENEEVLFEARSKALKLVTEEVAKEKKLEPGFNTQGVGQLRVLKHRITGKTRLLLRAEPGSNIVINTALTATMTYKATETKGSGAVKFGIPTATGIDHWVAKVKTPAMAEELAGILEANKGEAVQK